MQKVTQKNVGVRKEEVGTGRDTREYAGEDGFQVCLRSNDKYGGGEERAPDQENERERESVSTEPPP